MKMFRLPTGKRKTVFMDNLDNPVIHATQFEITTIWKDIKTIIFNKSLISEKIWEKIEYLFYLNNYFSSCPQSTSSIIILE